MFGRFLIVGAALALASFGFVASPAGASGTTGPTEDAIAREAREAAVIPAAEVTELSGLVSQTSNAIQVSSAPNRATAEQAAAARPAFNKQFAAFNAAMKARSALSRPRFDAQAKLVRRYHAEACQHLRCEAYAVKPE